MMAENLPIGRGFKKEEIRNNFFWHEEGSFENLEMRILVPKNWHNTEFGYSGNLSAMNLTTLTMLASEQENVFLHIQAVRLEREISAELWLRHYMIVCNYSPEKIVTVSDQFADSFCGFELRGQPFCGRIAVRIHGNIAFVISLLCKNEEYLKLSEIFGVCVASFTPLGKIVSETIEECKVGKIKEILSFKYPASWLERIVPAIPGKFGIDILSINGGYPTGFLRVKAVSKEFPTRRELQVENALEEFASAGVVMTSLYSNGNVDLLNDRFTSGHIQIFHGLTTANMKQEMWIVVLESKDYFVNISLLSPDRRDEFLLWAWNRCALDIVTKTLN